MRYAAMRHAWIAASVVATLACVDPGRAATTHAGGGFTFDGQRAMADIATQLRFTPRSLDAPGHAKAVAFIEAELAELPGLHVREQRWRYKGADGTEHALDNIIASTQPGNPRRVLVGSHYDSIVRAYRDPAAPNGPMPGANNSASGVAVLLETARALSRGPKLRAGVDLVFFDGEEGQYSLGAGDANWFALGSPYFVSHLPDTYPGAKPMRAVVLDMVCYRNSRLKPDLSSARFDPDGVKQFWKIGQRIAPSVFASGYLDFAEDDDHTALSNGGIPSFLVIGIEYEPWFNTTQDTIDKCSAATLSGVGNTLIQFLAEQ